MKWTRKVSFAGLMFICLLLCFASEPCAKILWIHTFDTGETPNQIGGDFGIWNCDPYDMTQGCEMQFSTLEKYGTYGKSLRLVYDVESPHPAYNGLWSNLEGVDATLYNQLVLFVKGDEQVGFTTKFNVELKNNKKEIGRVTIKPVTGKWRKFAIPFDDFVGISDWTSMKEFVIVFDDQTVDKKAGAIFIDNVCFSDGRGEQITVPPVQERKQSAKEEIHKLKDEARKTGLEVQDVSLNKFIIPMRVQFESGKSRILPSQMNYLDQVAELISSHQTVGILIEGHTDSVGSEKDNLLLSENRAKSVFQYLVEKKNIQSERLRVAGCGENRPIADNRTKTGRAMNRRVEFHVEIQ